LANPLKKLASQTAIYGLGSILPRFINYAFSFVLTYIFKEPAQLAPNAEFFAYISFFNILFLYGMETAFFNFYNKTHEIDKDKVYSTALISILSSTVVFTLFIILFSEQISWLIKEPEHANYVVWCILIVASDAIMQIPFARLRQKNNAKKFAGIKFITVILTIALNIFFFIVCKKAFDSGNDSLFAKLYNPEIGIGYAFIAQLIANLISIFLLSKEFKGFSYTFDFTLWKKMFLYAWPLIILGLAGMVNETFDRIVLKYILPVDEGSYQIGVYSNCYKIAMLMSIFIQAFKFAAEPFFFNSANAKNSKYLNALVMKYFVIFCLFLFLGTMMNLPWIQFAISEKYRAGLMVVPILLLANLFLGVYFNLSIWYKLTGQTKFGAVITLIGAVITLSINFLFIPHYGYIACAWATFMSYGIMMVLSYLLGQNYYKINYNLRSIFVFTLLALGLYFISCLYHDMKILGIKIILNNALLVLFAIAFYVLEFKNLKKFKHIENES
jgi:O-antigen/teichoic acid export membrane protein